MKKIVITGACGHIGSYLIRHLPNSFPDSEFVLIDNLQTCRFSSLFKLNPIFKYRFFQNDILKDDISEQIRGADWVIHLAAITDAAASFSRAATVKNNNYESTKRIIELCIENGSSLILASSTSVYGVQDGLVSEACAPEFLAPQSPYAESKLSEEQLFSKYQAEGLLKGLCFRFGTIFGVSEGMRFHTAVNKFCWQAAMGQSLTVWSTALNQRRPYLALTDCLQAVTLGLSDKLGDKSLYNVLSCNASVGEIIDYIKVIVPSISISFVDHPIMNQLSYEVDVTRIEEKGFRARGSLKEGVMETLAVLDGAHFG